MYGSMLLVHSWMRWIVLILGAMAVLRAIGGVFGGRPWGDADDRAGLFYSIALDLQFLVGLLLYLFFSPTTRLAFADMGVAMKTSTLRFWAVEHVTAMLVAIVIVHAGRVMVRHAADGSTKHRRAAIFFGVALVLILALTPWPGTANGRPWLRLG